jgi:hypothetical protein
MHIALIAARWLPTLLVGVGGSSTPQAPDVPAGLTEGDWQDVRAAYEAGRHFVDSVADGHRASNPGQRWSTHFDGRGFTTRPDGGGWSWGLELRSWGIEGSLRAVADGAEVVAAGQRVTYDWDEDLQEWYLNDARGLEHGYVVHRRPECLAGDGRLAFVLGVRGGLSPSVSGDGRDVTFVDSNGFARLAYRGLIVLDADGRSLPAGFVRSAAGLRLSVDDRGARYPLLVDPIAQQAYIKASNTDPVDAFGGAVSLDGDTLVVGARNEGSRATGVNGNQTNNLYGQAGAAYVFVRSGSTWAQQAYLKASNTEGNDFFADSVSVSGDTIAVGAFGEDSNATGIDGKQNSNNASAAGAVYVFVRTGTTWAQQAYVKASNTFQGDRFGASVSVSGDTLLVGADGEDSNATGVNGNQNNNSAGSAGAAYVFVRSGTVWSQQAYLKASNTGAIVGAGAEFGCVVSVSGDTAVVGAPFEDGSSSGVNGNQFITGKISAGAAYVFVREGTTWSQQAYVKASNPDQSDEFATALSISGDTLVVGAYKESSAATGVNGDESSNIAQRAGAAYVFVRSGSTWSQEAYLKASNSETFDVFGLTVAASGDFVVVGAEGEDSVATGINGIQSDNSALFAGAAYVFERSGTTWSQLAYLKGSNTEFVDYFGSAVAVHGGTVIATAAREDSNATGVNGNQANNDTVDSGAAYVFDMSFCPPPTAYCTAGTSASGCTASISATGTPSASATSGFVLGAANVEGNKDGLFFFGTNGRQANSWGSGTSFQCVIPPVIRGGLLVGSGTAGLCDGTFGQDLNALWCASCPKPAKNPGVGAQVGAQLWYRDPFNTSNQTTSLSDAMEFYVLP